MAFNDSGVLSGGLSDQYGIHHVKALVPSQGAPEFANGLIEAAVGTAGDQQLSRSTRNTASRNGVRLTPSSSETCTSFMRAPGASLPRMIRSSSARLRSALTLKQ